MVGTGAGLPQPDPEASDGDRMLSFEACRDRIATGTGSMLVLFGTGWGLVDEVMDACDHLLPGVQAVPGRNGYNHLSVRAAVAIILDRLAGDRLHDPA